MYWIISANSRIYDHASSFAHFNYIDWRQGNRKFEIGDTVYIYCTTPLMKIRYKCEVTKINMSFKEIRDDKNYWIDESEYYEALEGKFFRLELLEESDSAKLELNSLKTNGLKAAPQSAIKVKQELLTYIESAFTNSENEFFPDTLAEDRAVYEGARKEISVNKYERSPVARAKCIEAKGCYCNICNFNFEAMYGELGKGFIHVHHVVPIYTIGESYKIDYEKDLIPVCPNCHAMLHKKFGDSYTTISELREIVNKELT